MSAQTYKLFFTHHSSDFADGTLLELENKQYSHSEISGTSNEKRQEIADWEYTTEGYLCPDMGFGIKGLIFFENLVACPPFSENLPPSRGLIQITKATTKSITHPDMAAPRNVPVKLLRKKDISITHNVHFQKLEIILLSDACQIEKIVIYNKVRQTEAETYYAPKIVENEGKRVVECEMSHVYFGFYSVHVMFQNGWAYHIDLIKHFPDYVKEKYISMVEKPMKANVSKDEKIDFSFESIVNSIMGKSKEPFSIEPDLQLQPSIINDALALSTEWGENFRKPIHERLLRKHPHLSDDTIKRLYTYVQTAESYIYRLAEQELEGNLAEGEIAPKARQQYQWISDDNLSRLINIGMYYARK